MPDPSVIMPDGTPFEFWDDTTEYTRAYHIACEHPEASDDGPGTEERPFATIGRAAQVLQPGEKAVVHGGVYRECVRPARGGDGPNRMIAYEAASGEDVYVRGSRVWAPKFAPSEGWPLRGLAASVTVWMADMPETWFVGYNPFLARNVSSEFIIRRNHVSGCGVCGIAGSRNNDHSLVEDNLIEYIGSLGVERISETAGLKFHHCNKVLIRRNVFRHLHEAPGIWLDVLNINSRVTGNVLADIEGSRRGGIYIEETQALNVVDHNIIWDLRGAQRGPGVYIDCGEKCVVAHNLFAKMHDWYAVGAHLRQKNRIVAGRVGLCRQHKVLNNILIECPKRILFARSADNISDGNLFDRRDDYASLCIEYPEPSAVLNLSGWQEFYGLDPNSRQTHIHADFDPETLVLTLTVEGEMPVCSPVEELHGDRESRCPGPVELEQGRREYRIRAGIEV